MMIDSTEIVQGHPLFGELRNSSLLWHCTSPEEFMQMRADGFIKPNEGHVQKWGPRRYACQELGGISLFDFATESEGRVLESAHKWQQFLGCARPVTIALGIDRCRLSGQLTAYPKNLEGTTGNVIPWVEVCHGGNIVLPSITSYILICAADYSRFYKHRVLDESAIVQAQEEFRSLAHIKNEAQVRQNERLRASLEKPEFKEQLARARQAMERARKNCSGRKS